MFGGRFVALQMSFGKIAHFCLIFTPRLDRHGARNYLLLLHITELAKRDGRFARPKVMYRREFLQAISKKRTAARHDTDRHTTSDS
jgi:hypothetical protein